MPSAPLLSLVLDVEGADAADVRRSVASLTAQTVKRWELLLHGPAATALVRAEGRDDSRVRAVDVSGPTLRRVEAAVRLARGETLMFLAAGDALASPEALEAVRDVLETRPDVDLGYGDELVVDADGALGEEVQRPVWSPERLLGEPWLDARSVPRTELVRRAVDEGLLDPWERDLVLARSGAARRAERLPGALVRRLRRTGGDPAPPTLTVVRKHPRRTSVAAEVVPGAVAGTCQAIRAAPEELSVTVVVPTCGRRGLAWGERRWFALEAVRSLLHRAGHARLEVVVVHTAATDLALCAALLALDDCVRLVPFHEPYSPPAMVNLGVAASTSDVVVLADERLEVESNRFLDELLGPLTDGDVGMTGPRLLTEHGNLVDAGLAFRRRLVAPLHADRPPSDHGPGGVPAVSSETSGLGSGCLALRRSTLELAGGLMPALPHGYHIDLAFKLRHLGLRRVWVPSATARLLGVRLPFPPLPQGEARLLRDRWLAPDVDEYDPLLA